MIKKNKNLKKIFLEYYKLETKHEYMKNITFFGSIILTIITLNFLDSKSFEYLTICSILLIMLFLFNKKNNSYVLNLLNENESSLTESLKEDLNQSIKQSELAFYMILILFLLNFNYTNYFYLFLLFTFVFQNLIFYLFFKKNRTLYHILITLEKYDKKSF